MKRGGQDGPVAEFASRACRPGRAPAYIIGQQAQTARRAIDGETPGAIDGNGVGAEHPPYMKK